MSRVPRIRFKGFEEYWEQRKLGEIAIFNPKSKLPSTFEYVDLESVIGTEMVSHSTETISTAPSRAQRLAKKGDIFYQTVRPYQKNNYLFEKDRRNYVFSTGYAQLRPFVYERFLFYLIQNGNFVNMVLYNCTGTSYPAINSSDLRRIDIYLSRNSTEQKCIGDTIKTLDHLITLHQRKLEKLKIIKKSMLENIFPQNGEKTPKIRFSGFTNDWEQRKLGEIYTKLVERNIELLPFKKILSVSTMTYKGDGNGAAEESLSSYKRLRVGDIAFEGHTSKDFRYGRFVLNDTGDGIMSPRFSALRPISYMPIKFWKYYIHYEPIMKKILVNSTKSGTMMNELVVEEFSKEILLVPKKHEQQKIGRFFYGIDHLITLHQSKLKKLQKIKKSMLESMFV